MRIHRRRFLQAGAALLPLLGGWRLGARTPSPELRLDRSGNVFLAPDDLEQWPAFRAALATWRAETKSQLHYKDDLYRRKEFAWSASNYSCCFLMTCDERFWDWRKGRYAVDALLEEGEREFGGYDSVVLWHAYPRLGLDQRNQFDFYRDLPGGLSGLRHAVRRLHRRGVKVYIDYNPWDLGTRRESVPDLDVLAGLVRAIEADGIFLDTMSKGAAEFRAKLDAARPGVILEGEGAVPLENIHDHHASWAQWFGDSDAPGVLRHKWFERRHMQHQIRRWDHDHIAELHAAWMNGSGMMVWENVFGSWVPWSPRDRSILRSMLPIQRRFNALFSGEGWTPLVPVAQAGIFASLWEGHSLRLWTLVNRTSKDLSGTLLRVSPLPQHRYFDLLAGREIQPTIFPEAVVLSGAIPSRGIGCFLSGPSGALGRDFARFLQRQAALRASRTGETKAPEVTTSLVPARPCPAYSRPPAGMVELPAANLELTIEMRVRECGFYDSTPPTGDVYNFQTRRFRRAIALSRFAMDETLVTNAQYADFLKASGYHPAYAKNFLRHWHERHPPKGLEDHPVVYVDLEDSRAYANWAGKRLPTEEEWQYAAQGTDGRRYPWGEQFEPERCNAGETGSTTPVKAFPRGRSPFGCYDMCGNVWQWTESQRSDGRTRFCIIRGGAWYAAKGSGWYMDGGPRPANFAAKFLMTWPGLDRCGTIGFRCGADLAAGVGVAQ